MKWMLIILTFYARSGNINTQIFPDENECRKAGQEVADFWKNNSSSWNGSIEVQCVMIKEDDHKTEKERK